MKILKGIFKVLFGIWIVISSAWLAVTIKFGFTDPEVKNHLKDGVKEVREAWDNKRK